MPLVSFPIDSYLDRHERSRHHPDWGYHHDPLAPGQPYKPGLHVDRICDELRREREWEMMRRRWKELNGHRSWRSHWYRKSLKILLDKSKNF